MKIPKARPIEDVMAELRPKIMRMLPGGQAVGGSWAAYCAAAELMREAKWVIDGDPEEKNPTRPFLWIKHGEYAAGMRIMHRLADAFKVESVVWIEVPDVEGQEAVGEADPAAGEVRD